MSLPRLLWGVPGGSRGCYRGPGGAVMVPGVLWRSWGCFEAPMGHPRGVWGGRGGCSGGPRGVMGDPGGAIPPPPPAQRCPANPAPHRPGTRVLGHPIAQAGTDARTEGRPEGGDITQGGQTQPGATLHPTGFCAESPKFPEFPWGAGGGYSGQGTPLSCQCVGGCQREVWDVMPKAGGVCLRHGAGVGWRTRTPGLPFGGGGGRAPRSPPTLVVRGGQPLPSGAPEREGAGG